MPAYTPIRHFIEALQSGETNITKRLKYLVQNYDDIPQNIENELSGWNPDDLSTPMMPQEVKELLMHSNSTNWQYLTTQNKLTSQNKLSQDEVDHIDAWPAGEKKKVKDWVVDAKNKAGAQIYWELDREAASDYAYRDPNNLLKITCRTSAARVNLGPSLGSITYG